MIDPLDLNQKTEALKSLLKDKHGLRSKTLDARLRKAGRLLPKWVHKEGKVIKGAVDMAAHPKLAAMVDVARVDRAFTNINNHLEGIDPKDRRKGKLLGWLGGQVFNLILIGTVLIVFLWWRGLIG